MKYAFFLAFLTFASFGWSQDTTEVATDSIKPHSVRKATILSAVLPGAGQVYNHIAMPKGRKKAFWKVPLIYAGLGATTYFLISNQTEVNLLKAEYNFRQDNGFPNPNGKYQFYDNAGILTLYDQYARWRDFSILGLAGVYLFQIADAAVEAHFVSFDVSEDLSMVLRPTMMSFNTPGLHLSLKFR